MRKPFIWPLIGIISFALIGLIFVQLYWIDSAIKLRRSQFKQNVNSALIDVTEDLERMRRVDRFRSNEKMREYIEEVREYFRSQQQFGMDPFQRFSRPPLTDGFGQGVDLDVLDSLLRMELEECGIEAGYRFGVFDRFGEPLQLSAESDVEALKEDKGKDVFMVRLFPTDFFTPTQYLRIYFPQQRGYLIQTMWIMLLGSAALILIIILAFSYTIYTILRQKKLSQIKNDLIGNMTHEFKTPISTISLACEALQDPDIGKSTRKDGYVQMIQDENKRLGVLVENVLRSAVLDRGELKMKWEELDLHRVVEDALHNIRIQVEKQGGKLEKALNAKDTMIEGDRIHLVNLIYNLLDNALKYSSGAPDIEVRTRDGEDGVILEVADSGIGIRKEEQKKIFDRLYRISTGNIHNVKGTGLGLSYVKVIAEKHGGKIGLESEPGKGSRFWISFPKAGSSKDVTEKIEEPRKVGT